MFRFGKMYEGLQDIYKRPWLGKMTPFKVFGNTYFVGTYQASCHLIDTGEGLIMIDPGYTNTAYLVIDSIYQLGFKPQEVKYIINTHWHGDHIEATAAFAGVTLAHTRAHFARALCNKGYVSSPDQAFKKYLNPDRPYYRKRAVITPEEAIRAIRNAGGFPVLAHPCQYKFGWNETEELILSLRELGLGGLECYHSSNNQYESGKLRVLADKHALAVTGGSDFHGAAKPDIQIGVGRGGLRVSAEYLDTIKLAMFFGL